MFVESRTGTVILLQAETSGHPRSINKYILLTSVILTKKSRENGENNATKFDSLTIIIYPN